MDLALNYLIESLHHFIGGLRLREAKKLSQAETAGGGLGTQVPTHHSFLISKTASHLHCCSCLILFYMGASVLHHLYFPISGCIDYKHALRQQVQASFVLKKKK